MNHAEESPPLSTKTRLSGHMAQMPMLVSKMTNCKNINLLLEEEYKIPDSMRVYPIKSYHSVPTPSLTETVSIYQHFVSFLCAPMYRINFAMCPISRYSLSSRGLNAFCMWLAICTFVDNKCPCLFVCMHYYILHFGVLWSANKK